MSNFVSYIRVSTQKQGASGLGLEAQREAVARHLGTAQPLAEFMEIESGKSDKNRPELLAALDLCKRRRAVLLIAKLDRLSRNVAFIANLMESGVEFVACDNPHANRLMLHMLAAFAEHEREMISARTKAALAAAKARGTKLGNPRWCEALTKARQVKDPNPIPEAVVELMRQKRSEGQSLRQIADHLNALNLSTPNQCRWYASTVRKAVAA